MVDNQSSDGTPAVVRERWPAVQVIDAGGNLGFARANNLGIAATTGEYVLLLNPDTIVPPGALPALVARPGQSPRRRDRRPAADGRAPRAGAVVRSTDQPVGRTEAEDPAHALPAAGSGGSCDTWSARSREAGERAWVSGACLLIRRADLEAVGGLDERFFMYTEDVDLCTSVRARGRKVLFVPAGGGPAPARPVGRHAIPRPSGSAG